MTRPAPAPQSEPVRDDASATVLVAEDEEGVRQLAVESLERRGYRVMAAASGEEALKLANAFDGTIHLLLSDVVMPGMKGPELAERLRALRPGIRVLLMSGYAADVVTPSDLKEATLLSKPFAPAVARKPSGRSSTSRFPRRPLRRDNIRRPRSPRGSWARRTDSVCSIKEIR